MSSYPALLALSLPLALCVQQEAPEVATPPQVVLESASGETRREPLEAFELGALAESGVALVRFEGLEAVEAAPSKEGACEVHLARGAGLALGELLGGDGEELELRLAGGARLRLSIEEIASLRVPGRVPDDWTQPIVAGEEGDRLYRTRGLGLDRIDGTVEGFDDEGVTMDTSLGTKSFPWREVAALFVEVFDEEGSGVKREGDQVVVDLLDGSRLPGTFQRLSSEGVELVTAGGCGLRLLPATVAEVFCADAGLAFLSELEPSSEVATSPFGDDLGMSWPVRRDRSTTGGPLRAGGRVWSRGLGVHAPSRVEYDLAGRWRGLRGSVAVDDEVVHLPARGSVRFRIHGDGELLWESAVLRGGDPPVAFPELGLEGVQTLLLEVDMAEELHAGDRADWLRLILVR